MADYASELYLHIQSLEYETEKTVLFWDILWHKNIVCINCETNFRMFSKAYLTHKLWEI